MNLNDLDNIYTEFVSEFEVEFVNFNQHRISSITPPPKVQPSFPKIKTFNQNISEEIPNHISRNSNNPERIKEVYGEFYTLWKKGKVDAANKLLARLIEELR